MENKLTKGNNSNYEIDIMITLTDYQELKQDVLRHFQKDYELNGFRKGFVPLSIVEEGIKPEYLEIGIYEEAINKGVQKIIQENKNIKFIGLIYDLKTEKKEDILILRVKIDHYPELDFKNDNWKIIKIEKINDEVSQDEIELAIINFKKQFAKYENYLIIENETVSKLKFTIKDNEQILDSGNIFIGEEEYNEFPYLKDNFYGKSLNSIFEIDYLQDKIHQSLHYHGENITPTKIEFEVIDIKKICLPELTQENIKLFVGDQIKDYDDLVEKIKDILKIQKFDLMLKKSIYDYISEIKKELSFQIPQTYLKNDYEARLNEFKKSMGGEEKYNNYLKNIGEEKTNNLYSEIAEISKINVENYLIIKLIAENLEIDEEIDWEKGGDAEKKIYAKLISLGLEK